VGDGVGFDGAGAGPTGGAFVVPPPIQPGDTNTSRFPFPTLQLGITLGDEAVPFFFHCHNVHPLVAQHVCNSKHSNKQGQAGDIAQI
jgi:hypothetical protein